MAVQLAPDSDCFEAVGVTAEDVADGWLEFADCLVGHIERVVAGIVGCSALSSGFPRMS